MARRGGGEKGRARRALVARRVLEIYAEGGGYDDVVDELGVPHDPATGSKMNADELLAWAHGAVLGERAKKIGAALMADEVARLATANIVDFLRVTPQGDAYVDLSALTREQAAALSEVTVEDFTDGRGEDSRDVRRVKIKLHDKRGALELALKAYGVPLATRVEQTGPDGGPIRHEVTYPTSAATPEGWAAAHRPDPDASEER